MATRDDSGVKDSQVRSDPPVPAEQDGVASTAIQDGDLRRSVIDHLPVGAVSLDGDDFYFNDAAAELTGYGHAELRGLEDWFIKLHGPDFETVRGVYESCLEGDSPGTARMTLTRKDGEERIVECSGNRHGDQSIWLLRDVTEEVAGFESLHDQAGRIRAILDATADAIVTTDLDGIIIEANASSIKAFGYSGEELRGSDFRKLILPSQREKYDESLARHRHGSEADPTAADHEFTGKRKDGSTFPIDLAIGEVKNPRLLTCVVRDISIRKRMLEEIQSAHEFNERLLATTPFIILVLDYEGRIVRYNQVLERITGRRLEDTEGCDWFETFLPERNRDRIRELFQESIEVTPAAGNVNPITTLSGEEREIEWHSTILHDAEGLATGLFCSGIDITDRLRLEQSVYQASEEEKIRIAGELHDGLGSLLGGIACLAGSLRENLRNEKPVHVTDAEAIVTRLREAVTLTRTLSHGLHGIADRPNALPTALMKLAEEVRATSSMECRFLPPYGDVKITNPVAANHLFRIAQEAVNNAIRHSGATHLTISLEADRRGRLKLVITDDGHGIAPEVAQGDGIGLSTMRYRARAIGAEITFRGHREHGTRVECLFPNQ